MKLNNRCPAFPFLSPSDLPLCPLLAEITGSSESKGTWAWSIQGQPCRAQSRADKGRDRMRHSCLIDWSFFFLSLSLLLLIPSFPLLILKTLFSIFILFIALPILTCVFNLKSKTSICTLLLNSVRTLTFVFSSTLYAIMYIWNSYYNTIFFLMRKMRLWRLCGLPLALLYDWLWDYEGKI